MAIFFTKEGFQMSHNPPATKQLFVDWYADQYDGGVYNYEYELRDAMNYLQGFIDCGKMNGMDTTQEERLVKIMYLMENLKHFVQKIDNKKLTIDRDDT
jgi:hypothetical protein